MMGDSGIEKHQQNQIQWINQLHICRGQITASFRVVAAMRAMGTFGRTMALQNAKAGATTTTSVNSQLEDCNTAAGETTIEPERQQIFSKVEKLFRGIEMPLLYAVSDAERGGIRINPEYFTYLR